MTAGEPKQSAPTPEQLAKRAERSEQAHAQRARSCVRRYIRANRCRFMWTLTERDETRDFEDACAHLDAFLRALRETFGRIPLVAVPEPQPGGHAWHWHLAADRFMSVEKMRRCWPYGHVWVGDGKTGRKTMPIRKLARYLAKYIGKQMDGDELPDGFTGRRKRQHRYRLTEGFDPDVVRVRFSTAGAAYLWLQEMYGKPDAHVWFSVADDGEVDSVWLEYPDRCLHPPPVAEAAIA